MFNPFKWMFKTKPVLSNFGRPNAVIVVNKSTVIDNKSVKYIAEHVLQTQVSRDFAPLWGIDSRIIYSQNEIPNAPTLFIMDNSDQANALGYHDISVSGIPTGFVFVKTAWADGEHWTTTASHELLEMLGDPFADLEVDGMWAGKPAILAYETCDPVEGDEYIINTNKVSNFVTPYWFEQQPPTNAKFDFLGKLSKPMTMTPSGYVSYATTIGTWQQAFGQHAKRDRSTPIDSFSRIGRRARRFHAASKSR